MVSTTLRFMFGRRYWKEYTNFIKSHLHYCTYHNVMETLRRLYFWRMIDFHRSVSATWSGAPLASLANTNVLLRTHFEYRWNKRRSSSRDGNRPTKINHQWKVQSQYWCVRRVPWKLLVYQKQFLWTFIFHLTFEFTLTLNTDCPW